MRLVFTVLLIATVTVAPATAQTKAQNSDEVLRQRLLLKERFNRSWDVQLQNAKERIEPRCKAEARKRYSALHPLKRRKYVKECIARARH